MSYKLINVKLATDGRTRGFIYLLMTLCRLYMSLSSKIWTQGPHTQCRQHPSSGLSFISRTNLIQTFTKSITYFYLKKLSFLTLLLRKPHINAFVISKHEKKNNVRGMCHFCYVLACFPCFLKNKMAVYEITLFYLTRLLRSVICAAIASECVSELSEEESVTC